MKSARYSTDIVTDNSRAGEVIRRMRALVKKEKLEFAPIDIASVIGDVVQLVDSDGILRNIHVEIECQEGLPERPRRQSAITTGCAQSCWLTRSMR